MAITEKFLRIKSPADLQQLVNTPGIDSLTAEQIFNQSPDIHWVLLRKRGSDLGPWMLGGRCSLWWKQVPTYPGERLGFIGHYAVADAAAADRLLNHACEQLFDRHCTLAIAPIDGNTWQDYRFVLDQPLEGHPHPPPFFLEPNQPQAWVDHCLSVGFNPFSAYYSAINNDLTYVDPSVDGIAQRLVERGVTIRSAHLEPMEATLKKIYRVAVASFRHNFLYSPIPEAQFFQQYQALLPYIQPELVLLAEQGNQLVGFLLALPDWLQAQRGETIDTIIIKTVAVLPKRLYAGLGHWLVAHCQQLAHQLGYQRSIHALMHENNPSRNLSDRYAQTFRRYALFAKSLKR